MSDFRCLSVSQDESGHRHHTAQATSLFPTSGQHIVLSCPPVGEGAAPTHALLTKGDLTT